MKKQILAIALVFAALVPAVASAQTGPAADRLFPWTWPSVDVPTMAPPCDLLGPASMQIQRDTIWLVYTCKDNQVILRAFGRPIVALPTPYVPIPAPVVPDPVVPATPCAAYPGMVEGIYGGCVPASHPLAKP